jgi:hypothetical protein
MYIYIYPIIVFICSLKIILWFCILVLGILLYCIVLYRIVMYCIILYLYHLVLYYNPLYSPSHTKLYEHKIFPLVQIFWHKIFLLKTFYFTLTFRRYWSPKTLSFQKRFWWIIKFGAGFRALKSPISTSPSRNDSCLIHSYYDYFYENCATFCT